MSHSPWRALSRVLLLQLREQEHGIVDIVKLPTISACSCTAGQQAGLKLNKSRCCGLHRALPRCSRGRIRRKLGT